MKVLVVRPSGGAFLHITHGFINAFNDVGITAQYWDGNPATLIAFKPDLYIGCSGHRQEIPQHLRSNIKIATHTNPYGQNRLDKVHGVDINEPQDAITWVIKQKPNVVFGYGHKDDSATWGFWTSKHGLPFVGVPTAGDATAYWPDPMKVDYDIAYLGGYWSFKGHKLDAWLMPVIREVGVALMGWGGWGNTPGYRGVLPDNDSGRQFLSSAKVGPCISEPHTSVYGIDIPERFFKVALCGAVPISDYVPGFERYYPKHKFLMASSPSDYKALILNYARNPAFDDTRRHQISLVRKHTLAHHTYHSRMRDLCAALGFTEAVAKFEAKIAERLAANTV